MWEGLVLGLSGLSDPMVIAMMLLGCVVGTLVGALPGLGSLSGCALLLPISYRMQTAEQGLVLLCSIFLGNMFGGRITAILINVPGDASAVVTAFDGYPMKKAGRGGVALGITAISSFFGGLVSFILLAGFAPPLARLALRFGPPEYFAIMLFGFAAAIGLGERQFLRGMITLFIGILISLIGLDWQTSLQRYVFRLELYEGVDFAIMALGLFGLAEVLIQAEIDPTVELKKLESEGTLTLRSLFPTIQDVKECIGCILRGTFLGAFIGFLPGAGATIATFVDYSVERSISKTPEEFGKGKIQGVAGPEAANNASVGGSMIPMFALGIPGSSTAAIIMGAMMMFSLKPGPRVFQTSAKVVWTIITGLIVANIVLLLINTLFIPLFVKIIDAGFAYLKPIICVAVMLGVFAIAYGTFFMFICIVVGLLGYVIKKLDYPPAPLLLALVLFESTEVNFRQALIISRGDPMIFFARPISCTLIVLSILCFMTPLFKLLWSGHRKKMAAGN